MASLRGHNRARETIMLLYTGRFERNYAVTQKNLITIKKLETIPNHDENDVVLIQDTSQRAMSIGNKS